MDNQKLDEIRRTLQHLQQIATEPIEENDATGHNSAETADLKSSWNRALGNIATSARHGFEKRAAAFMNLAGRHVLVIGTVAMTVIGVAGWFFSVDNEKPATEFTTATIPATELTKPEAADGMPAVETTISEAQELINAGKIDEARRRLIDLSDKSPEAALTLARSYDPNYLRLIPDADAIADPKEAERWYRVWRDIAASKGLALEKDRLDRIINAMH